MRLGWDCQRQLSTSTVPLQKHSTACQWVAALLCALSDQNLIVTGSNEALGYDLTVEPSLEAGPSGVDEEDFVADDRIGRWPMLNQPPLTVSSCAKLSSLFEVISRLPVSRELRLSGSEAELTVMGITKGRRPIPHERQGGPKERFSRPF